MVGDKQNQREKSLLVAVTETRPAVLEWRVTETVSAIERVFTVISAT
jgi:hypothetical protein